MNSDTSKSVDANAFGVGRAWMLVFCSLAVCAAGLGWFAFAKKGLSGLEAVIIAAGVCLTADSLALLVKHVAQQAKQVVNGVLFAMLVRMGLPLGVGLYCLLQERALVEAGLLQALVVLYLVGLAVETAVTVRMLGHGKPVVVQRAS